MEKHCTTVYFSLRESKQNKNGESPIEVSISTNGERIYFNHISKDKIREKIRKLEKYHETTKKLFPGSVNSFVEQGQIDILKELI